MNQNKLTTKQLIIVASLVVILIAATIIFMKFPYYIKSPCQFSAQYVWSLVEVEPGKLLSRLSGNNPQHVRDFNLMQFDRPDFLNFSLSKLVEPGQNIEQGDLIGTISSTVTNFIMIFSSFCKRATSWIAPLPKLKAIM